MLQAGLLFAAGLGIGGLGTLIGAGGGWMIVPILLFGLGFPPQEAVATSLAIVFLNALSGSVAYMVQGRVLYRMGTAFAAATIPGALLGAWLVQYLGSRPFTLLFGLFLLLVALILYRGGQLSLLAPTPRRIQPEAFSSLRSPPMRVGVLLSFLVGVISSLFGIGGGIVHVPFLIIILGLPVHAATATSHFVLAITSLTGSAMFYLHGQIHFDIAVPMGLGVLLGAQGGALLSMRMEGGPIRRLLAGVLALFALGLIVRTLWT